MFDKLPSPVGRDRPFPWLCIECGAKEVYSLATDYTVVVKHDDHPYTIRIVNLAIPTCRKCGEQIFSVGVNDRIIAALRAEARLLTPDEIKSRREHLELSQNEMAEQLGVSEESYSRWERGAMLQSRVIDNLLRVYFESQEVRTLLSQLRITTATPKVQLPAESAVLAST